jgi:hypothetical protein
VSIGLTEVTNSPSVVSLLQNADTALYYSKDHGRNQINSYEELLARGAIKSGVDTGKGGVEIF